jgi:hypothetical protein
MFSLFSFYLSLHSAFRSSSLVPHVTAQSILFTGLFFELRHTLPLSCLSFSLYPFFCFLSCLPFSTYPQSSPDIVSLFIITSSSYRDWLRAERVGRSRSPGRVNSFLFSTSSRPVLGSTQPPIQWVPTALSPEVKRPGREADHSPPTSAEVKKM